MFFSRLYVLQKEKGVPIAVIEAKANTSWLHAGFGERF